MASVVVGMYVVSPSLPTLVTDNKNGGCDAFCCRNVSAEIEDASSDDLIRTVPSLEHVTIKDDETSAVAKHDGNAVIPRIEPSWSLATELTHWTCPVWTLHVQILAVWWTTWLPSFRPADPVATRTVDDPRDSACPGANPVTDTVFSCPGNVATRHRRSKSQIFAVPSQDPLTRYNFFAVLLLVGVPPSFRTNDKLVTGFSCPDNEDSNWCVFASKIRMIASLHPVT
mmetsp:Transcript_22415/g.52880  ORF Transcript_22415/g.52880 Transcript_22415/m.52880 type:complete len:227 (-) Transcript_22415:347-1027(-)